MDPNTAIQIRNLSKQYRLGLVGTGTLSHDLKRWWTMNIQGKEDPYLKIGETNTLSPFSPSPQPPKSPSPSINHSEGLRPLRGFTTSPHLPQSHFPLNLNL